MLGDWEKQGTFAWEILNGEKHQFTLASPKGKNLEGLCGINGDGIKGIDHIIKLLEKHSGRKARRFDTQVIFGKGINNVFSGIGFLELGPGSSGLGWGNDKITEADGQQASLDDIYSRPDLVIKVPV